MQACNSTTGCSTTTAMTIEEEMNPYLNASLVAIIAIPGFLFNLLSFFVFFTHPAFRNSFGRLTTLNVAANCFLLLFFVFWSIPLIFSSLDQKLHLLNERLGQLSLFFAEITYNSGVVLSINRLVAISLPVFYRKYFTMRITYIIIGVILALSFLYWLVYFIPGCSFYFDVDANVWMFSDTKCGILLGDVIDLKYNLGLLSISIVCDFVTMLFFRGANMRMKKLVADEKKARQRTRKEIIFFLQSFSQTCGYVLMFVSFHIISASVQVKFHVFLSTTIAWASAHAFGGFIIAVFNKEIRLHLSGKGGRRSIDNGSQAIEGQFLNPFRHRYIGFFALLLAVL
ncbi:unnamed protein product [Auanema sp. JU1783]|nr:unnamed protein product [Auanema sp. JU1783]